MNRKTMTEVDTSIVELLELANVDSPYTSQLVNKYCVRLTKKMLRSGKIDKETAQHLCPDGRFKSSPGSSKYFLVN